MKTPERLETLLDEGIVHEVVRPLMSGKEAQIYVVRVDDDEYVAKVYKEASERTFKHRAAYTEGRRSRNSRDQRAVSKRSRHGRKLDEAAWRSTEVDMIYRLRAAGVRVPEPINFVDGVLVMELVRNAEGEPAPRLGDLSFGADEALAVYRTLIQEVVRMLCAGVIHGDLSDFNVLMGADGPVLIDFPQSVDPAHNQNARKLLLRDVENLHRFLGRFSPDQPLRAYAQEMWALYESNRLKPDSELRGDYRAPRGKANTKEVMALIEDASSEEHARRHGRRTAAPARTASGPLREVVDFTKDARPRPGADKRARTQRGGRADRSPSPTAEGRVAAKPPGSDGGAARKKRRSRRRRKSAAGTAGETTERAARSEAAPPEKKTGAGNPDRSKRRRRGRRSGARSQSGEAKPSPQDSLKRPAKPGASAASEKGSDGTATGADRPSRRRRRRPRSSRTPAKT
jgi:RIO kinase 1